MNNRPPTTYEPEEYPRCTRCGRMAFHAKSLFCALCLLEPPSPLAHFTASDFTPAPPDKK